MMEEHSLSSIALEHRLTRLEEWYTGLSRALELQAAEYARRLEELNHEAKRMAERDRLFIPRETFDVFEKELLGWRYTVNQALSTTSGRNKGLSLAWSIVLGAVALAGAFMGVLVALQ